MTAFLNKLYESYTKQKGSKKIRFLFVLGIVFFLVIGANCFFNRYFLVSPIILQNPIRLRGDIYPIRITEPELENIIDEEIEKALPTPTDSPVRGVLNDDNRVSGLTHPLHQKKEYYDEIIGLLKVKYTNWENIAEIIGRESGFNPYAVNSSSGACGLHQAYPCSKMNCELSDINCQLDWGKSYIVNRYGTESQALAFWKANGWY